MHRHGCVPMPKILYSRVELSTVHGPSPILAAVTVSRGPIGGEVVRVYRAKAVCCSLSPYVTIRKSNAGTVLARFHAEHKSAQLPRTHRPVQSGGGG